MQTILEIGSGSLKLHKSGAGGFTEKYQSSLGKNMQGAALAPESVAVALKSVSENIIPYLKAKGIDPKNLLVFATAAVRKSQHDASGKQFLAALYDLGIADAKSNPIRIFSEDDECRYAALGVINGMQDGLSDYSILDTGGASHQLIEVRNKQIIRQVSIPIGSHSDHADLRSKADFIKLGFTKSKYLVVIGTSSTILNAMDMANRDHLREVRDTLVPMAVSERREYLTQMINASEDPDKATALSLLVDYRLMIIDKALSLILNCADQLEIESFYYSKQQAMHYVSQHGFQQ